MVFVGQNADLIHIENLRSRLKRNRMGIMARKLGTDYVISSDRSLTDAPVNRAPKRRASGSYEVWTGEIWSTVMTEAKTFGTLDDADEYVRANFKKVTGQN
jgi:hypothetical protein